MDPQVEQYREQQEELIADSNTIMAAADAEKRDLSDDELAKIKANKGEFDRFEALIEARETSRAMAASLERTQGRITEPDNMPVDDDDEEPVVSVKPQGRKPEQREPAPRQRAKVIGPASRLSGSHGFRSFGDFTMAVKNAAMRGGEADGRLMAAAASTFGNEGSGTDGGFAVPPDFRATIMEKAFGEDSLLARTDRMTVSGNSLTFPTDMTTPWSSTGIQAYWESEASAITQSKPALQEVNIRAHKLAALVPVTEELLEDSAAMGAYVGRKAAEKIDYKLSTAIAYGNGVGQPLGFMNSAALVTQAKVSGQSADTIVAGNATAMYSCMPVESRRTAVWLIHPDAEHQLPLMTIGDQPVYLPPGGLRNQSPYGLLLGRPVIPHQVCQTVGDLGDFMFVDLMQYATVVKSGGVRSQASIHLWFDQDLVAFKFTIRVGGQPWWSETTTAANGSFAMSPFVTLAART